MTDKLSLAARNRETVQRFLAGTHSPDIADVEVIHDTVAPGIVCHGFPAGLNPHDHESYKEFFRIFRKSFSNMAFELTALIADDQFATARFKVACDHTGAFAGVAPTGNRIEFDGMVLYRMDDGRIAETWLHLNEVALLGQIGAISAAA